MSSPQFGGTQPHNYEQRCPVVLVIDTSPSMASAPGSGAECSPIAEVNAGLATFATQVRANATTAARLDVAVVGFDSASQVRRDFALLDEGALPRLTTGGSCTDLVAGVDRALALLAERKRWYDEVGLPRYRGYLLVITDGQPTNSSEELASLRLRLRDAASRKRQTIWAFGTTGAALPVLRDLFGAEQVQGFAAQDFSAFFQWLSTSFEQITASREGEVVQLDNPGFFRHTI
ncbi:MAG: hypothetical protein IPJ56_02705 [Gemmatimonadetes bacterium]|nr:hypothetical protein [Gemmatimonadota bacterium]